MKIVSALLAAILVACIILGLLESLGIDTKFPRGFIVLTILDLAALKGWLISRMFAEVSK